MNFLFLAVASKMLFFLCGMTAKKNMDYAFDELIHIQNCVEFDIPFWSCLFSYTCKTFMFSYLTFPICLIDW